MVDITEEIVNRMRDGYPIYFGDILKVHLF